jgi:hypothetical protein
MSNDIGVFNTPLPIDNPTTMLLRSLGIFLWSHALFGVYISSATTLLCHHVGAHITSFAWACIWKVMLLIVPNLCVGNFWSLTGSQASDSNNV